MSNYTNISTKIQEFEKQSLERTNKSLRENVAASIIQAQKKNGLEAKMKPLKGILKG